MDKEGFFLYGAGGGIDRVWNSLNNLDQEVVYESIKDALDALASGPYSDFGRADLSIVYYTYDDRIKRHVYMVVTKRWGKDDYIKMYGIPCFVSFMVSTKEESNE